jgi:hypothetical protein
MKFHYLNVLQDENNHQSDENVRNDPFGHVRLLSAVFRVYEPESCPLGGQNSIKKPENAWYA